MYTILWMICFRFI